MLVDSCLLGQPLLGRQVALVWRSAATRLSQSASHRGQHVSNSRPFLRNGTTHVVSMDAGCLEAADEKLLLSIRDWARIRPFSRAAPTRKSAQIISSEEPRGLSLPRMKAAISSASRQPTTGPCGILCAEAGRRISYCVMVHLRARLRPSAAPPELPYI